MVEVRVLGTLQVAVGGATVALPADARARELLGWLAVNPGAHPRSALAGRLRPDVAEESARKSLRDAVYKLRTALGPDGGAALVARRDDIGLEGVQVDLHEFRRLRRAGDLPGALAAAQGELLPGIDADWAMRARDEHDADVVDCAAQLAADAEAAGDLAAALSWTRRRIELEPLGEGAHRDLVRLLALTDDRPAALRAAAALSERLRRELGVPPSATTRALVEDIKAGRIGAGALAGDAVGAGPGAAAAPSTPTTQPAPIAGSGTVDGPSRAARPPLALPAPLLRTTMPEGRAPALARLEEALAQAATGLLTVAVVAGEAGIGKTTLAGAIARQVHDQGGAVLYGRSEEHALVPYQPWVELLEGHLRRLPAQASAHWLGLYDGALARLLPTRLDASAASAAGPNDRYLAFEAAAAMIVGAADAAPALVVLDDLHWADDESLALLRHVVRVGESAPLLLLLCARDEELNPAAADLLAALRRLAPPTEVQLAGLDVAAIQALLARRHGQATAATAADLHARTGGNPFFVDALLREERAGGDGHGAPPPGVRDVMRRRLDRLGTDAHDTLAIAAVIGLEFELSTVAAAAGRTAVEALETLDDALAAGLVLPSGAPGGRYAFAHALVLETLLVGLTESRRARLHLQIADALEASPQASTAGELVRHLRAAGSLVDPDRLAHSELGAADEASAGAAPHDAAEYYAAAVTKLPLDPGHVEVLLALGHARDRAGERDEARAAFERAFELAKEHGNATAQARAALGHGGIGVMIAAPDPTTVGMLEAALDALPADDRATAARLRARLAVELYYADIQRARELSDQALNAARASGDAAALVSALNARRVALWDPDHADERLAVSDEMVAVAAAAGDREGELQARNWRVVDLWELGRIDELRDEIDAYERLADAVGLPHYRWWVPLWRGGLAIWAGEWDRVERLQEEALRIGSRADDANAPLMVQIQAHAISAVRRRHADVDRDWVVATAAQTADPGAWEAWLAQIDSSTGRMEHAAELVQRLTANGCAALSMNVNWISFTELAEAVADVGDRAGAGAIYERLKPYVGRYPVIARGVGTENVVDYTLGRLAATMGRTIEAVELLRRSVELNEQVGARSYTAMSLLRLTQVLVDAADADAARAAGAQAMEVAGQVGIPEIEAEVRDALQTLPG